MTQEPFDTGSLLEGMRQISQQLELLSGAVIRNLTEQEQADLLRRERVQAVTTGHGPITVENGARLFLHIIPIMPGEELVPIGEQAQKEQAQQLFPLNNSGGRFRINVDGYLRFDSTKYRQEPAISYVQIFRSGMIEFCDTRLLGPHRREEGDRPVAFGGLIEQAIVEALGKSMQILAQWAITRPVMAFITLTGVRGYYLKSRHSSFIDLDDLDPIVQDSLYLPGILNLEASANLHQLLKPVFDRLWNAAGYAQSLSYNGAGDWVRYA